MPNPLGPDRDQTSETTDSDPRAFDHDDVTERARSGAAFDHEHASSGDDQATESYAVPKSGSESATQAIANPRVDEPQTTVQPGQPERRFTAPGFDAKETTVMRTAADPATEVFSTPHDAQRPTAAADAQPRTAMPQLIPPRLGAKLPASQRSWGWVLALILIILALAAIAVMGTVLLTRNSKSKASQEQQVRTTIQTFDTAVQNGDLAALRSMTCGSFRDDYESYGEQDWNDTYHRVAAAKQYPVVASIDQVVVNGDHAEANVTAFMAFAPQTRSARSFDLQFRDDQWKVCQSSNS